MDVILLCCACHALCVTFTVTQLIVVYGCRIPIRYTWSASILCNNSPIVEILNIWQISSTVACGSFPVTPRTLFCITLPFWWVLRATELESFDLKTSTPLPYVSKLELIFCLSLQSSGFLHNYYKPCLVTNRTVSLLMCILAWRTDCEFWHQKTVSQLLLDAGCMTWVQSLKLAVVGL